MKIAILSRNSKLYSTKRLLETARVLGHEVRVLDPLKCYMNISSESPEIYYKGKPLKQIDAIIPRIGASITFYGTALLRQFELMGVWTLNPSMSITRGRDKLRAFQLLSRKGIGLPKTGFAHSQSDIQNLIATVGGAPLIIKLLEGTQGIGVVLVQTTESAVSTIEAFLGLKVNILAQEFISEAKGSDIRCIVVGDKVIASMQRQAKNGEFRSNLHQGGTAKKIRITPEERSTAIKAVKALGLKVAGVDLIRSKRGPLVLEVNASPGLQGIETAAGINVAEHIIRFVEKNAKKRHFFIRKSPKSSPIGEKSQKKPALSSLKRNKTIP